MIFAILQLFQEQLNTDMIKIDEPYVGKIAIQKVIHVCQFSQFFGKIIGKFYKDKKWPNWNQFIWENFLEILSCIKTIKPYYHELFKAETNDHWYICKTQIDNLSPLEVYSLKLPVHFLIKVYKSDNIFHKSFFFFGRDPFAPEMRPFAPHLFFFNASLRQLF